LFEKISDRLKVGSAENRDDRSSATAHGFALTFRFTGAQPASAAPPVARPVQAVVRRRYA
jgi:hypothetical protein